MPNVRNSTNKLNTRSVSSAQQEANRRRQEELRRRREAERRRAEARRKQEEARRRQEEARRRLAENSRQREQAANRNRKTDSSMRGGVSGKTASKANRVSAPSYTERLSKEEKMRRAGMQLYQWTQQAKEQKLGKNGLPKSFMPEQNAAAKSQNGMFDLLIPKKQAKQEFEKNGSFGAENIGAESQKNNGQGKKDMVWSWAYGKYVPREQETALRQNAAKNTTMQAQEQKGTEKYSNFISGKETIGQKAKSAIDSDPQIAALQKQIEELKNVPLDLHYKNPNDPNFNYVEHLEKISALEDQVEEIKNSKYYSESENTFNTLLGAMSQEYRKNPDAFRRIAEAGAAKNPVQKEKSKTDTDIVNELYSVPDMTGGMVSYETQKKHEYAKEWTDDELLLLNYLYGSGRKQDAKLLEEILERDVNARYAQKTRETISKEFGTADGQTPSAGQRAAGVLTNFALGAYEPGQALGTATNAIVHNALGSYVAPDVNSPDYHAMQIKDIARGAVTKGLSPVAAFMAETGMSILDSASTFAVAGPAAPAIMGARAAGQSSYQAIQAGAGYDQAAVKGFVDGAAEMLMEKIPVDNLLRVKELASAGGLRGIKTAVKETMKQAGVEATEEGLTEVANIIADIAILKDKGEVAGYLSDYIRNNPDATKADQDIAMALYYMQRITTASAGGAISGGVMSGGTQLISGMQYNGEMRRTKRGAIDAEAKAKAIMENAGIRRAFNPNDTVTLANGNEGIVIAREGNKYVVAETGKQGHSSVNIDDITGKVRSSAQSLNKYIAPEVRAKLNEKYDARHVERTANQVFLDKLTQGRGIKAVVEDMQPGAEAFYDRTTNTIHFAPDSTRAEVIGGVTAHELAHAAEGSPNYAKYSDYVMEKLFAGDSAALAQAIEAKQEQYILRGIDLSDTDAAAEIVADYTRQLYKNEADIDALVTGNRSMAQSIYDSIKTAIRKIRAFFKGDSATLANIREYQELQRAQKLFERALSTRENVQTAAPAYALNEFGLEEYTNNEIQQRANSKSILFANSEQDIVDFVNDYIVNRSEEYKRLYIGKVGEALADRIFEDTGIDVGNYNVILRSDFENRHANVDAEQSRGQIAITPELIGRLPEIISAYDSVAVSRNAKNGKPALVFEKDVDGKKVAVEYISDKRKEMALQTMYGWENKKNHPTAESAEASPITSETRSGTGSFDNIIPQSGDDVNRKYSIKGENPLDIANLTKEAADTTPVIPLTEEKQANGKRSKFTGSVENSPYLEGDIKELINSDSDVKYYEGIANEDTLDTAYRKLKEGNREEVVRWLTNESKKVTAEDVAEGFILLKQYQDAGDYGSMISVARKLRKMGTQAGQTVQAFSILSRMTPEGMVKFAQAELDDAFEVLKERKSKNWLENNSSRFTLTDDEVQMITDNVLKASNLPEGRDKNILLAEISALIQNKLPSSTASKFRALQRISLLLNPKTNVRNILGNALMMPERIIADFVAAPIDRAISKKTGVRTTGVPNILDYGRGFKKGAYESYNDFRRGINTLNREGNRFEIGEAPAFNPEYAKTKAGKALTKAAAATDRLTSFVLEMGDRPFYEAYFVNSLNNQMKLANVTEPSADMIEIATQDALENTYQDNNGYTKFVEGVRRGMNFGKDFGFGNIVIPFAKTPANLTKALVEFSPVGLVKSITADAAKFNRAVNNGTATPQMQRKLVNNIGKGVAGTLVMLLGAFLASEGIISGAGDDDKDAANFARNVLGIQPYSVVIGGKSYTYDWAAPVGPQFAIAADIVNNIKNGDTGNFGMDALGSGVNAILNALQTGGGVLFEQSFLRGIQDFFKEDNLMQALINSGLSVIGQYIPSLSNQIAQLTDPVQRTTYAYNNVLQTGMNKAITRIPGLSQTLEPTVDVYGREVQRYGGDNNVFNVMVNPANVAAQNKLPAADEVWRLYQQTGDKTVFPSVAPYYIKYQDEKYDMSPAERTKYQKTMGQSTANVFGEISASDQYRTLTDAEKAELAKTVNEYSSTLAKKEYLHGKGVSYTPEKWIEAASKSKNPAAYIYYHVRNGALAQDAKREDRINLLFEAGVDENELIGLYSTEFEDKNTNERSTIAYAQEQGVRPSAFVERELQRTGEVGTAANPKEDLIYEDGQVVYDEKGQTVSGTKKAQACGNILSSGYTNEEKMYFYQKEYSSDDNFGRAMQAQIPVDAYLQLQRDKIGLKGEKDENGKTISGSVKEQYVDYVNSLPLDEPQKLLLIAQQYKVNGNETAIIREYVSSLELPEKEKESILAGLKLNGPGGSGRRRSGGGRLTGSAAAKKAEKAAFELSQVKTLPDLDWSLLTPKKTAKAIPNTKIPDILAPLMIGDKIREETLQKELAGIDESPLYTSEMKQKIKAGIRARYRRS